MIITFCYFASSAVVFVSAIEFRQGGTLDAIYGMLTAIAFYLLIIAARLKELKQC